MQKADLVYRYIQPVTARILQQQIIPVHTVYQHGFHTDITANAVHIMHHIIAAFNIGKVLEFRSLML